MITLVFGDSFIGPLKLIKDNNLKIIKFQGATMKGITKTENTNRKKIIDIVNKNKNKIKCMIFNFGQVDLFFSYYYVLFVKKETFKMEEIILNYVKFIKNLKCNDKKKIVLSVYPTVLKDKNV